MEVQPVTSMRSAPLPPDCSQMNSSCRQKQVGRCRTLLIRRTVMYCPKGRGLTLYGSPTFSGVWWAGLGLGVRPCWSLVPPCQVSTKSPKLKYKQKKARSTRQMRVLKSPGSIFPFHTLSDHICIYIYCIYTGLLTNGENMTHHNATNA